MTKPRLILDTSSCGRIRASRNKEAIVSLLNDQFRLAISVQTFWEILNTIDAGDGSYFEQDRELLRIAAGNWRNVLMLPTPTAYALHRVLGLPLPQTRLTVTDYQRIFDVVMRAKDRNELYTGVRPAGAVRQRRAFDPAIVRQQMEEGEAAHVRRLTSDRRAEFPTPEQWARGAASSVGVSLSDDQARRLAGGFDAAYRFDQRVCRIARDVNYNAEKHMNDWIDMQQLTYLCDNDLHLIASDGPLITQPRN